MMLLFSADRASAIGGWLGRHIGSRLPVAGVARENLAQAFPEKTSGEREDILKGVFENFGRTLFEYPHIPSWSPYDMPERFEIEGAEHLEALAASGKPGVLFSGHFANWEAMPDCIVGGPIKPLHIFYRAPSNRRVLDLFENRQADDKIMLQKGPQGARQAVRVMKNGGYIAMLVDQKQNDGIAVPFFGRDAMTAPALASFALKFDAPLIPIRIIRTGGARFKLEVLPPLEYVRSGDMKKDVPEIMGQVNQTLEDWIREYPDQWLWMHRRWPRNASS